MRRLVISDLHSNFDALQAVLADAAGQYDEIVCCGDVVGYNARPVEVVGWVREHVRWIVRGNHDVACSQPELGCCFNLNARIAVLWTVAQLSTDDREWLRQLPKGPMFFDEFELAHGSPADEDEYLIDDFEAERMNRVMQRKLCFVGHTHLQGGWSWRRGGLHRLPPVHAHENERVIELDSDYLYLINPGSVGQPRDRDPRAAYALWDSERRLVHLRRVEYDVSAAQARIEEARLPRSLADRLAVGR